MPGLQADDAQEEERLKAALWYSTGQTVDAVAVSQNLHVQALRVSTPDEGNMDVELTASRVYNLETGRYGNDYDPSVQDLADYYLAAFKTCVRDAHVGSIMCSYNAVGGYPSCANEYLLEEVLREHWGFNAPGSYVVSDCGAVTDIYQFHNFTNTEEAAASVALNAGTDIECGSSFLKLNSSLADGQVTLARMDQALTRLYSALFTVGYFDGNQYTSLDFSDVATPDAQNIAYTAAHEGMTLLQNNGLLPLGETNSYKNVAVIGPYANATTQMQGDYSGTPKYLRSPLSAFQNQSGWNVTYAMGTLINAYNDSGISAAVDAAKHADLIIYLGGIDGSIENEQLDRTNLTYPSYQLDLISQLAAIGAPMVVVTFATPHFIGGLSEMCWAQIENIAQDLEAFAKHGGRSTINAKDVVLLARRNEGLSAVLQAEAKAVKERDAR